VLAQKSVDGEIQVHLLGGDKIDTDLQAVAEK
jgi:hypothetical protein